MSEQSKIQWCDSTINFWSGCTKVSAGCQHCYAEARDRRHMIEKVDHWGKGAPRLKHKGAVKDAFKLNRLPWICDACGGASDRHYDHSCTGRPEDARHTNDVTWHRRRIFSLSLGDWLDPEVPIAWLAEMLDTIRQCDQVTWILCTKRPELFNQRIMEVSDFCESTSSGMDLFEWIENEWLDDRPPKNIWLLTSVENQQAADERIPALLKIPAVVHGLSLEPLLGPVDLTSVGPNSATKHIYQGREPYCNGKFVCNALTGDWPYYRESDGEPCVAAGPALNWLIVGGESGPLARPCNVAWISSIIEQGRAENVATFVKQLGAYCVTDNANLNDWPDDTAFAKWKQGFASARAQFKHNKGGDLIEWPEELRVREFPEVA